MKITNLTLNLIFLLSFVFTVTGKPSEGPSAGLEELFPGPILDSDGNEVSKDVLSGKTVGIYFSAHWCPPCKLFTPELVKLRDANEEKFEVVFVSNDHTQKAQMNYMKEADMKWYTLPYRSATANALAQKFQVRGIPSLVIVSDEGKIISKDGVAEVRASPQKALKSWQKKS